MATHDELRAVCRDFTDDLADYGSVPRALPDGAWRSDCSHGCRWFHRLAGNAGLNYGVCTNPRSHRAGLLTFEHQGCVHFELENEKEQ